MVSYSIFFGNHKNSDNREQLAAAGILVAIPQSNRPHLQRSQSHSVSNSSPPSPSPNGHSHSHSHSHSNGYLPPLNQDRFGTSPMGSRSVGPASSKYFGTSSPSSFQGAFGHSSSYQGEE